MVEVSFEVVVDDKDLNTTRGLCVMDLQAVPQKGDLVEISRPDESVDGGESTMYYRVVRVAHEFWTDAKGEPEPESASVSCVLQTVDLEDPKTRE